MRHMKKIMVVDDNEDIITYIKKGFEDIESGYEIIESCGGESCIEILKKGEIPDLILLDIMMPDLNGWRVFKIIKENNLWERIPVVFLTAKTDNFSKGFGKLIAHAFIEKPFEIDDLKQRIDCILDENVNLSDTKKRIMYDMIKHISEENNDGEE